jgi:hypothetical protein
MGGNGILVFSSLSHLAVALRFIVPTIPIFTSYHLTPHISTLAFLFYFIPLVFWTVICHPKLIEDFIINPPTTGSEAAPNKTASMCFAYPVVYLLLSNYMLSASFVTLLVGLSGVLGWILGVNISSKSQPESPTIPKMAPESPQ